MYSDLKERIMPFLREMDDIYSGSNQKIIAILDEYEERMKGAIEWGADDMSHIASESNPPWVMSEDEAQAALEEMIDDHDATIGVNWETVAYYVEKYRP